MNKSIALSIFFALSISSKLFGQRGYIKLKNDSILIGFLRLQTSFMDGHPEIELWKSKNDKNPKVYKKVLLKEYAIKKDTFRILQDFKPFEDKETSFYIIDAKLIIGGKVELLQVKYTKAAPLVPIGAIGSVSFTLFLREIPNPFYVLNDPSTNYMAGVRSGKTFSSTLSEFFEDNFLHHYSGRFGKIHIKDLKKLVQYYNDYSVKY